MSEPLIVLRGLEKHYGTRRALADVDLEVEDRQILGVVGPDGAGKTTLLRALAGLLEVRAREARVLGVDLTGEVTPLKARLGYVPQAFSLHGDLSVMENLRFTARLHRLPEDEFAARARELLERTALARFARRATGAPGCASSPGQMCCVCTTVGTAGEWISYLAAVTWSSPSCASTSS